VISTVSSRVKQEQARASASAYIEDQIVLFGGSVGELCGNPRDYRF